MLTNRWKCLTAILFVFGVALPAPADDPPAKQKDDPVDAVRKAAETAEVHGVSLYEPFHDRLEGVTEIKNVIVSLRSKDRKGARSRVWEMLGENTKQRVFDDAAFKEIDNPNSIEAAKLTGGVRGDLEKIIDRPDFYTEEAFKAVLLSKDIKDLITLGKKRTAFQTAQLNWALLKKTFPSNIPDMPERFRTVRVQVVQGKDVVLVLSCASACRWEVKLFEGAKVTGVILCGGGAGEVVGVDAPIVYRCSYDPDGITRSHVNDYFYAHDKSSERYKRFVVAVKQITKKDLASFQGKYRPEPGDEPFTVRPKGE